MKRALLFLVVWYNTTMLNIYYADALTDKERFIFDHIDPEKKTILIVPDQFSLQAERDALAHAVRRTQAGQEALSDATAKAGGAVAEGAGDRPHDGAGTGEAGQKTGGAALLNLMVTDFSALGHKVVKETAGHEPQIIDKYGRHILLSVLIDRMKEELTVLRPRRSSSALAEQMNAMISELKRYEIGTDRLAEAIDQLQADGGSYLVRKLTDVLHIYEAYEEAIAGIYRDAEDYITYYADRIPGSQQVAGSETWIYGFDTFTPKNLLVIRRILETASSVSVVLTYEDRMNAYPQTAPLRALTQGGGAGLFRLTEQVMAGLEAAAAEAGCQVRRQRIEGYARNSIWNAPADAAGNAEPTQGENTQASAQNLAGNEGDSAAASEPQAACGLSPLNQGEGTSTSLQNRIQLVQASTAYEEAESAAAFIQSLVRDQGYRYGEIAVLCNDMDGRGRMLQRVFSRWEIPAFADQKRRVLHQPVVSFLLSFLEVLTEGLPGSGIMGMVKSGLLGWSTEDETLLENYITTFHIRGSRWRRPFVWDGGQYTEEQLVRLNEMRTFLVTACDRAKEAIGRRNTGAQKVQGLMTYLQEDFAILERIEETVQRQQELGLQEGAAETAQIWNAVCGLLEQIAQVVGEEKISNILLREMVMTGLGELEIGLVPASRDCVVMGTLQRTRPGQIRALVVTGANAGLLPLDIGDAGLLSRHEKSKLEEMQLAFAGREHVTQMEEQLAIYRMFSLPSQMLYVSCSQSGDDGSMQRPSEIFRVLRQWQPQVDGDLSTRETMEQIGSHRATVPYLAAMLREHAAKAGATGDEVLLPPDWEQVLGWYESNDPQQAGKLLRGVRFSNRTEVLGEELTDALYRGDRHLLEVSASRLEKFSGCPFAHFMQYGLRAREQRLFEVGGREIGDVYHRCMMEFSRQLEADSAWHTITEDQCRQRVAQILAGSTEGYREGLFASDEQSRFRMDRITEICGDIAWAMVEQVRRGHIRQMYFEEPFRRGGRIPPVDVTVGGQKIRISGIIDRVDLMQTGEGEPEAVRIVDYKTGSDTVREEDFRSGYKLQLMVYMDAALQAGASGAEMGTLQAAEGLVPAGVFYFKIRDFAINGDETAGIPDPADSGDLQRRMRKFYRMEGILVNDPASLTAMDEKMDGRDKAESLVIPVKYDPKKESYVAAAGGSLLEREGFRQLMEETNRQVENICEKLVRGEISAVPKRETHKDREGNRITACRYCGFQSVCGFDPAIRGCRYEDI